MSSGRTCGQVACPEPAAFHSNSTCVSPSRFCDEGPALAFWKRGRQIANWLPNQSYQSSKLPEPHSTSTGTLDMRTNHTFPTHAPNVAYSRCFSISTKKLERSGLHREAEKLPYKHPNVPQGTGAINLPLPLHLVSCSSHFNPAMCTTND